MQKSMNNYLPGSLQLPIAHRWTGTLAITSACGVTAQWACAATIATSTNNGMCLPFSVRRFLPSERLYVILCV
jgi:hypothetical protein